MSDIEGHISYDSIYMKCPEQANLQGITSRLVVAYRREKWRVTWHLSRMRRMFQNQIVMVGESCEYIFKAKLCILKKCIL
jgi:hypothetical protein